MAYEGPDPARPYRKTPGASSGCPGCFLAAGEGFERRRRAAPQDRDVPTRSPPTGRQPLGDDIVRVRIHDPCGKRKEAGKSSLPLHFGSGRRIRTLTYRVRVCCATLTQSRYRFAAFTARMLLYAKDVRLSIPGPQIFSFRLNNTASISSPKWRSGCTRGPVRRKIPSNRRREKVAPLPLFPRQRAFYRRYAPRVRLT